MPRKIKEVERAKPPLESILTPARELNHRERMLTARDAANFLRVSVSWLAKARMRGDGPFAHSPQPYQPSPERVVGSACASTFSRLTRRLLALRPAHSRCHRIS
jgi:hypothetical protein